MSDFPQYIGKYKIDSVIAKGGMGVVYKAHHPTLDRFLILKRLTSNDNEQFIQRFNREARIMMDFKHNNLVNVYDHFKEGDSYYIAQEFVDGEALDSFIQRERYVSDKLALYIIIEVAKALKYAHDGGVIHRDIKPGNILISKTGDIKLVDFGIAISENEVDDDLTKVGATLGTPSYMAPEQFNNSKNVDKRADIYSLGVMLYELVTGKKPYPSGLSPETVLKIQKGNHPSPRKYNPDISRGVLSLIKTLMCPKQDKRVGDLEIIIKRINRLLRNRDLTQYKTYISKSVLGEENSLPREKKPKKRIFIPLGVILFLSLLALGYFNNIHNRVFLRGRVGLLRVNLRVSKDYYKATDEIFIKSKLFLEDNGKLTYMGNFKLDFTLDSASKGNNYLFNTGDIYLEKGYYRLKLIVDGNLNWHNFYIDPLSIQSMDPRQKNGKLLDIVHNQAQELPFFPEITVVDGVTQGDITESVTILIKDGDNFKVFNKNDRSLKTGRVHYFQIRGEGYYTREFILKVAPDQTNLSLNCILPPRPGNLEIGSNISGIKLSIDGNYWYLQGGKERTKKDIDKTVKGDVSYILDPGKYTLLFNYRGNRVEKEITVVSGESTRLNIEYNSENQSLSLK